MQGQTPYIIAKVSRTPITIDEYQRELQGYRDLLNTFYSEEREKEIEEQVFNNLIEKYLLIQEAKARNIKVSNKEIADFIKTSFKDFDKERFALISKQYPSEMKVFEDSVKTQIMVEKLKERITSSVEVSEEEAYQHFLTTEDEAKIKYISIDPETLEDEVEVKEEEIKQYYEKNKENLKDGPWRGIEYVLVSEIPAGHTSINVTPEEIERYYSEHIQEFTKIDTEIQPLDKVKGEIEEKLKNIKKENILEDKAFNLSIKLLDNKDWQTFAKNENLQFGTTKYFGQDDPLPQFNTYGTVIRRAVFSMPLGEVSEPIKVEKGYVIIRPLDKIPEYEEISEKIRETITESKKKDLSKEKAEAILSELKNGTKIEDITQKYPIEVKESDYFPRYGFIKEIGYAPEVAQTAFSLKKDTWEKVTTPRGKIFIIKTIETKEPSKEDFPEMKERITSILLEQKKQEVFTNWLEQLREENKNKISILWDKFK